MADDRYYAGFFIGHLHIGERNRIQAGQLNPHEREMLNKGEDPWAKFRGPEKVPPQLTSGVSAADKGLPQTAATTPNKGTRVPGQLAAETHRQLEQEQLEAQVVATMHSQDRDKYNDPDTPEERRTSIFETYKEKFDERKRREDAAFRKDLERTAKAQDLLQTIKTDPSNAHLPWPINDSKEALLEWYDEMSRPIRTIPFAEPSEEYLRRQRITQAFLMGQKPDPEDLANTVRDELQYERELSKRLDRVNRELSSPQESARVEKKSEGVPAEHKQEFVESVGPSEPSKIVGFIDSNLTWGSFGVIVAGLATLVSSAILLAFGWLMLTVSLYRHFFKGKAWYWQVIGTLLTALVTGFIILVTWLKFRPQ